MDVIARYINSTNINHFQKLNTIRCLTQEKYLIRENINVISKGLSYKAVEIARGRMEYA